MAEIERPTAPELRAIADAVESGRQLTKGETLEVAQALRQFARHRMGRKIPRYVLARYGDRWIVGTEAEYTILKTRKKGFEYLQFLVQHPGKQIPAIQVFHLGKTSGIELAMVFGDNERARVNLTKQIWPAIRELRESNATVGDHLQKRISTGSYVGYLPDPATAPHWVTQWDRISSEVEQNIHITG